MTTSPRSIRELTPEWWTKWLEGVRWADQDTRNVLTGQTGVRSRELFRVTAPFPCTWRIICGCRAAAPLNFPLALRLVLDIGLGSFTTTAPFDIAFNAIFNFEIPAQSVIAFVQLNDTVQADDQFVFGAGIAPNISPFVYPVPSRR